ncbi:MAG: TonB-dependent receptor [Paludibacteraceae bacterium]|nr:TonB-dependent receptor [Paludibacteraceae bacterium]
MLKLRQITTPKKGYLKWLMIAALCAVNISATARTMRIYGYVVDTDNRGIELANVYIKESVNHELIGTSTNKNGYYELVSQNRFEAATDSASITIVYSMLGYQTREVIVPLTQDVMNINVLMNADAEVLEEVEVRGIKKQTGTMDHIEAATTRIMPDATGGSIESILITFAGVNQNNELSSQYNVRGGSFDENEVYVNGMEVHRPLLIRSGQQEGLSFVNPEMVENVEFSAGGFDAQYGDKMSSVLDITYKRPERFEASINASLLGAGVYVGSGDSLYSQMQGLRYKTSAYMLGAMATAGNYNPNYLDYQTYETWKVGGKTAQERAHSRWSMSFLGNFSQNDYRFVPDSLSESFGGQDAKNLSIWYDGQEKDLFRTAFAAIGAQGKVGNGVNLKFDLSGFYTYEQENFDITGEYVLSNAPMDGSGVALQGETIGDERQAVDVLGTGIYHEHARNRLQAGVATLSHTGDWTKGTNTLSWGASVQGEWITDHINEWKWRDSAGYSMPHQEQSMNLYYAMRGDTAMQSLRVQGYIQNSHKWNTDKGQIILNVGARLNAWTYTKEVLPSPRASLVIIPGWKRDFCFRVATGLYYQAPFYKELRDTLTDAQGVTRTRLNRDLKAQRSVHVVVGGDYYFRAWGRPFKLTAEAYYKYMDRMISYTVDNVRVRYSGENDATGYAAGVDLKLYGELVPGADSWISFSAMSAKQRLLAHPEWGWIPSPQEQRYSFSMLFQDYLPQLPQLKFHIKFIWNDGMPFASPRNIESQKYFRMSPYRRIDIGATYSFNRKTAKFMRAESAKHVDNWAIQFEVFNLVGWNNVNSYFWINDAYGYEWASPNYLTGRRFNVKITIDLK